ncbi:TerC family protein [Bacillus sp. EB106-08-02-XG196]|jgi:YkoY family integral membrane protein|uniref:TerC family protein n=1 Tax=Bacillus sp. EB106-08-02-XG196 TaxID=2737049 RepID=UPI0015C4429C|nr:TerC family protein [Bacillus sp. EB106-08-02-XG196]NWQ42876.1 TerC family protein [Bacillus sp. EB106-08-02-XG196]
MWEGILSTYAAMLDWHMWSEVLTSPKAWGLILSLAVLECILSADNALVLSAFVKPLPKEQQKKALVYGLWGAYIFRFIFIGLGTFLIKLWWIKLIGALYLLWLAVKFFKDKLSQKETSNEEEQVQPKGWLVKIFGFFWATVISVELMDLAFSVDSILTALAVSEEVWVILLGGMIGILLMRGVATFFIALMDRVPELETTAYILITFIAIKMGLTLVDIYIANEIFIGFLVLSFLVTFIIHYIRKSRAEKYSH